ncbi:MAG TPA: hypothetical protein VNB29_11770, partial [Chthoniobacterales bacterium]|nr:hypothetical protein [Chthoniobacterales bacterium]
MKANESSPPHPSSGVDRGRAAWLAVGIFLLAALTFLPSLWNDFISVDDSLYVYGNKLVKGGITFSGIVQAFAAPACQFYHPFTMLSLMLDHQFWGLNPFGYHLTNLLWHASASAVLFLALSQMTGALWRSAIVSAIFAVHPLRVESVVWVAERKDVLSVFFFALTLLAYAWYARRPASGRYATLLGVFTVGLLCKTTLVAMPFLLLLLDYWPLGRFTTRPGGRTVWGLVREKIPLIVLAIAATVIAIHAQKAGTIPYPDFPLESRLKNAALTTVVYLGQTFLPVRLAFMYPFSESSLTPLRVTLAIACLVAITIAAGLCWRRRPYFIVGWLWYLGVLVPMIGLIQV